MMPGIMNQLGPDNMKDLRKMMGAVRSTLPGQRPSVCCWNSSPCSSIDWMHWRKLMSETLPCKILASQHPAPVSGLGAEHAMLMMYCWTG